MQLVYAVTLHVCCAYMGMCHEHCDMQAHWQHL